MEARIVTLEGFLPGEEAIIYLALAALRSAGYDTAILRELVLANLPAGYRGMSLPEEAALSKEALSSQAMLEHVLEEELLHLQQKASNQAGSFSPWTAQALEAEVDEKRKFPLPEG